MPCHIGEDLASHHNPGSEASKALKKKTIQNVCQKNIAVRLESLGIRPFTVNQVMRSILTNSGIVFPPK